MNLSAILALLAGLVALALAGSIALRYWRSRAAHHGAWAFGLALFGIASLSEALIQIAGSFSPVLLGTWYVAGAMLTGAWIGQGTILLMSRDEHMRQISTWLLAVFSVAAVAIFALTQMDPSGFQAHTPPARWYRHVLSRDGAGQGVVGLTIVLNIYGTVLVLGGTLSSGWALWRRGVMRERVIGNVLIAAGVLVIASVGSLTKFGSGELLPVAELIAAVLIYAGFYVSSQAPARVEVTPTSQP